MLDRRWGVARARKAGASPALARGDRGQSASHHADPGTPFAVGSRHQPAPGADKGVGQVLAVALSWAVVPTLALPEDGYGGPLTRLDAHAGVLQPGLGRLRESRRGRPSVNTYVHGAAPGHQELSDEGHMFALKLVATDGLSAGVITRDESPGARPVQHHRHAARLTYQTEEMVGSVVLSRHQFPVDPDLGRLAMSNCRRVTRT